MGHTNRPFMHYPQVMNLSTAGLRTTFTGLLYWLAAMGEIDRQSPKSRRVRSSRVIESANFEKIGFEYSLVELTCTQESSKTPSEIELFDDSKSSKTWFYSTLSCFTRKIEESRFLLDFTWKTRPVECIYKTSGRVYSMVGYSRTTRSRKKSRSSNYLPIYSPIPAVCGHPLLSLTWFQQTKNTNDVRSCDVTGLAGSCIENILFSESIFDARLAWGLRHRLPFRS